MGGSVVGGINSDPEPQEKKGRRLPPAFLVGLGGVVSILVIAILIFAVVLQPVLEREDEGEDIGEVTMYWSLDTGDVDIGAGGPLEHTATFRYVPVGGQAMESDRIYVASGNRLLALRSFDGKPAWFDAGSMQETPIPFFEASSRISTDPIAVNIGNQYDFRDTEFMIYVGTEDGSMHFIRDSQETDYVRMTSPFPRDQDLIEVHGEGSVTSLAVYSDPFSRTHPVERVFFGTSEGWLYAYPASIDLVPRNDDTWSYDFTNNEWTEVVVDVAPFQRVGHTLAYDSSRDLVYLFGGVGPMVNTELWSFSSGWEDCNISFPHYAVDDAAMVYHEAEDSLIVMGGEFRTGDTNQIVVMDYRRDEWREITPSGNFQPRHGHEMIYNNAEEIVMLYGGITGHMSDDYVWMFDLSNQTWWIADTPGPGVRVGHSMVYDSLNNRAIHFGGSDEDQYFNDTWAFDFQNCTWTHIVTTSSPSPRKGHSMAFDEASGSVLLFGGSNETIRFGDTWILDVSTDEWQEMPSSNSPTARFGHSMTVNRATGEAVLFGGDDGNADEIWKRKLGDRPILMAGVPLQTPTDPNYSPALTNDGTILVVNDGKLRGIRTQDGGNAWDDGAHIQSGAIDIGDDWNTSPVIAVPRMYTGDYVELILVGSSDGWLYGFYSSNGSVPDPWQQGGEPNPDTNIYGIHLKKSSGESDDGVLSKPVIFGDLIFLSSSSRMVYALSIDETEFGKTLWRLRTYDEVVDPLVFIRHARTLNFVDKSGRLYCILESGEVNYRVHIGANATAGISTWQSRNLFYPCVWVGGDNGWVYCYPALHEE